MNDIEESSSVDEIILLVHGIRTHGNWQDNVKDVLETIDGIKVQTSNYGYFDLLRFWCPFTRRKAIDEVRETLDEIVREYGRAKISVIAHSNGTYIVSKILQGSRSYKLHRLVLCGSIIPRTYDWTRNPPAKEVINDYATRDVWPVLATALSWGYGDTGRHPFRKPGVIDRGHDFSHSDYFRNGSGFVVKYWKPWFERGDLVKSGHFRESPWWLCVLSTLPLQWVVFIFAPLVCLFTFLHPYAFNSATQLASAPKYSDSSEADETFHTSIDSASAAHENVGLDDSVRTTPRITFDRSSITDIRPKRGAAGLFVAVITGTFGALEDDEHIVLEVAPLEKKESGEKTELLRAVQLQAKTELDRKNRRWSSEVSLSSPNSPPAQGATYKLYAYILGEEELKGVLNDQLVRLDDHGFNPIADCQLSVATSTPLEAE